MACTARRCLLGATVRVPAIGLDSLGTAEQRRTPPDHPYGHGREIRDRDHHRAYAEATL
jgi:hypothetical protein